MDRAVPITEGRKSKGGQNPPNLSGERPKRPGPLPETNGCCIDGRKIKLRPVLEVYQCGSRVCLDRDIEAIVTEILIEGYSVQYKVAWWDGRARNEQWVNAAEVFAPQDTPELQIGFLTP